MMFPVGITTDKYGNAYVTCSITNKVLVILADGKQNKEILKACDGLVVPRAIYNDKSENRLFVCNVNNGMAFSYFVCTTQWQLNERSLHCGPCDYKHETNSAVKWCVDCTEALCSTCFDVHKSYKILRSHTVISIGDHNVLQGIILDLSEAQRCDLHDKPSEYFCPLHDQVVCIKCIQTKHSQCTGWLPITEAADGVKSSVAKETIGQDLDDVIRSVEVLIDSHDKERLSNENVCKNLKDEASKVVQSIIKRVKELETEFVNTVEVQHQDVTDKIGSRTIIFLSIRKISKELSGHTEKVKSVTEEPIAVLKEIQLSAPVQSFLSEGTVLCHVQNDSKHLAFQPTKLHKVQSHIAASVSKLTIQKIELQKVVKIDINHSESKGMRIGNAVILPNKQLFFKLTESNNFVIYTSAGEFVRYLTVTDNLSCNYMTIVDTERLAFSYGISRKVNIFNILRQKSEKEITFREQCYGLSCDGKKLYAVGETVIFCVDLTDERLCISSVPLKVDYVVFLSVNGDKLYYADNKKDTVYCCNKNGKEIWSFKQEIMKFPDGIATDKYGNAYVTCKTSHNVLVISADGKHYKEILNAFDGLKGKSHILRQIREMFTCLQYSKWTSVIMYN
ncbi:unnamed protein product [Mytilus coruscus]|uniref:B box-type domain-containing protein n=1 Tax=Mytilus coruscus TaxID=42192 RepID=A0A6J8CY74_MYTCO|nr:unnamed protein product [Mytilus coruscus]